jgi:hypothetical protein
MVVLLGAVAAACSDGLGPESLNCSAASTRTLQIGQHEILDPNASGACIRLPAAGPAGAEHLYIPLATAGQETPDGISAPYLLSGVAPGAPMAAELPAPRLSAFQAPLPPEKFHSMLREREKSLAGETSQALFSRGRALSRASEPPALGEQRTFNVCSAAACTAFVPATATARSVGQRVAIFVDDAAPAGGYTDTDLDNVKTLFDQYLYPIDTVAFGRESDVDGNGVVIVLLTPKVNELSPDCSSTGRIILGYFFGGDLLPPSPSNPGSNQSEVFYGLVPDVNNSRCQVSRDEATSKLPGTFIHEFQHMISYNQHVLIRHSSSEDTWLNEGLSHFAEELGGRQVPDAQCPTATTCADEFLAGGDLLNAFDYLASPESFFLIEPGNSTGRLEERGANWLFVRWLADHFGGGTVLGTELTRQLVASAQVGSVNVVARTGVNFSTLVGEWQLANYLDDLPGFDPGDSRLDYTSWNFRDAAAARGGFPLVPDMTDGTAYGHSGTLRAGSGRHVLVVQPPNSPGVDLKLTGSAGAALPASIVPRVALVRIR